MSVREIIGMVLIVSALVMIPVAWVTSRLLWMLAFFMFVAGGTLFFSARNRRRLEQSEGSAAGSGAGGTAMPTDIHNYTGWRSGGRSETMDSSEGGGDSE